MEFYVIKIKQKNYNTIENTVAYGSEVRQLSYIKLISNRYENLATFRKNIQERQYQKLYYYQREMDENKSIINYFQTKVSMVQTCGKQTNKIILKFKPQEKEEKKEEKWKGKKNKQEDPGFLI